MKNRISILISLLLLLIPHSLGAQQPRQPALIINIVIGGMRYEFIDRYMINLPEGGLRMFLDRGMNFTESRYDFMQTNTPATLATLTTGCNPSVHGVIGEYWQDYTSGDRVRLIEDPSAQGLDCDMGAGRYSYVNLTVPTLGDELRKTNQTSKVITMALDPLSAVSMGGFSSDVYWLDTSSCTWTSSSKYMLYLPGWVIKHNENNASRRNSFRDYRWTPSKPHASYVNTRFCLFDIPQASRYHKIPRLVSTAQEMRFDNVLHTPVGNELVVEFARQVIIYEDLGKDGNTDILNICLDPLRNAVRLYGPESIEAEDMFYRIDRSLASLIDFVRSQFRDDRVLFVLTSDHGSSDSYDINPAMQKPRFNGDQFRTIAGSYLGTQYGGGNWITAYYDRRLYLNRNTIHTLGLNIGDVQSRLANFALQFRGISHVITSSAMQNSTFSDDFLRRVQNGFYPRRSGDMALCLMAGWIEEREATRSSSGSLFDYDTHVPLMFMGCGVPHRSVDTDVDMSSLAPTLARIMRISRPAASTAKPIQELINIF